MASILLVEQDVNKAEHFVTRLSGQGHTVVVAGKVEQALGTVNQNEPDVIVLDCAEGQVEVMHWVEQFRAAPDTRHIPVLPVRVPHEQQDAEPRLQSYCDDSIYNSLRITGLLQEIESALGEEIENPKRAGRILLVEDEEDCRFLFGEELKLMGHTVTSVGNGQEALDVLAQEPLDLILLDIMMPVMSGFEALAQIRLDHRLRHIPVIMLTAVGDAESVVKCIDMGADDYLVKPFSTTVLRARVNACLDRKFAQDRQRLYLRRLGQERRRNDRLIRAIFPQPVVEEFRRDGEIRPRLQENVAVFFADIAGFTAYCRDRDPVEVHENLQEVMSALEAIAHEHHVQKIKTIGDCFMGAAGLLESSEYPVGEAIRCGRAMIRRALEMHPGWTLRVGIDLGPVVCGVVGQCQFLFDIWGDTVNHAFIAQEHGIDGRVSLTGRANSALRYAFETRQYTRTNVKGQPALDLFEVVGEKRDDGAPMHSEDSALSPAQAGRN